MRPAPFALRAITAAVVGTVLVAGCAGPRVHPIDLNSLLTQTRSPPIVLKWKLGVTDYEVTTFLDRLTFTTIAPGTMAAVDDVNRTVSLSFVASVTRQAQTTSIGHVEASGLFEPVGASGTS